jgi:hypothetical protein
LRHFAFLLGCLALAGCGAATPVYDAPDVVAAAAFVDDGPPSITLLTTQNTRSGAGAHTALMINASQRVLYDPAGSFVHPRVPEQDDLKFGITDNVVNVYLDYHSRDTFRVVEQTVVVTPAIAEAALARARVQGAAPSAFCANYTSALLRGVPGFEGLPQTFYPNALSDAFAGLPGVSGRIVTNDMVRGLHNATLIEPEDIAAR